ncbi:MAG: restriction endonuclease subunit S [Alphaproteobacteria bacterium]|nr:restriction endonuclease subunit S [Alphaproteobacteria bacterium]
MPKYEAYKESGVDWLGSIPSNWQISRLKNTVNGCVNGLWGSEPNGKNELVVVRVADFDDQKLKISDAKLTYRSIKENERKGRLLKNGDLLIEKSGGGDKTLVGRVVLFDKSYTALSSNFVAKMTPKDWVDNRFLKYVFSCLYSRGINYLSIKQTTGIQNLDASSYLNETFCFPEKMIQEEIANFLDNKTEQIDEAIAIKETQIELLKERKQIIIQKAVTQGLNPEVRMKHSGVDWIGHIPEHWEIRRSKFLFTQRKERAWKSDVQLSATQAYGVIPQSEYEALSGNTVVKITFHLDKRKHVEKDDFVISMRSFQGGLERAWSSGCIRSSYVVLRPLEKINPDFYGYLLKLPSYIKALQRTGNFIRDGQDLNFDNFSQVDLFIPPLDEQEVIAKYVKEFMVSSDKGIELLNKQIAKLKEYKTTLINSAVTGKIKVA